MSSRSSYIISSFARWVELALYFDRTEFASCFLCPCDGQSIITRSWNKIDIAALVLLHMDSSQFVCVKCKLYWYWLLCGHLPGLRPAVLMLITSASSRASMSAQDGGSRGGEGGGLRPPAAEAIVDAGAIPALRSPGAAVEE